MSIFVFVTERCRSDAQNHALVAETDRFRDRVESKQGLSEFDPFPQPYYVKKKLGGRQGRLIAERRQVGDHVVMVFLTIVIRGNRAYDEFSHDPVGYGRQHLAGLVGSDEVEAFVEERTRVAPPPLKRDPDEAEFGLLYGAFSHHQGSASEDLVCETREWVEAVRLERIQRQLALFSKPCRDAIGMPPGLHFMPIGTRPGWGAWVLRSEGRITLLVPATDATATESERTAREIATRLQGADATAVLRASRRAYPALVLADDDLWIDLENEQQANMALSPEESEVLESARGGSDPFPLFINGRAGSGKSTILQYLFADLLFYYLRLRADGKAPAMAPPLYLTANGELLRVARVFIERLLRTGAAFAQLGGADLIEENAAILDEAFSEFQPHLLSLVPPEVRNTRFARGSRVDYARFRRMWMERFGKENKALREFGPDISWHVIRSYIKGMSSEDHLDPEDYAQLPQNQITVTAEAFRQVFERVWKNWYAIELVDRNLWDDQDLTRYVLDQDLARRVYPAVFCDEAQDFTRIELELLLRMNLFSDRSLQPQSISHVPFAFAGDQFQTLNPTGFRWDAIKASFVEKFIFELDPSRRSGRTDLNYRELEYNYRSTHKIVRFCNHIQALRAGLFKIPDLRPQIPWALEPRSFPVVWFRANDAAFWKGFREHRNFVVIVPCNEGEERSFVEGNQYLREHIQIEDGVPINVLSAGRAKGREYPAVLVYGFGEHSEIDIMASLVTTDEAADRDKSLPIQYFINRLYVAASRPKDRLVVVDTDAGFKKLWQCALEYASEQHLLDVVKKGRQVWASEIEGMTAGKPEELTRETASDPIENAKAFEAQGLARQDPFLLRQAAQAYRSGGDAAKARECRAHALEAEGTTFEAGEAYFEAGFAVPEGVRCMWRSGKAGWERLTELFAANPAIQSETEFQWARAITQRPRPDEAIDLLSKLDRRLDDPQFSSLCMGDPLWRDAIVGLVSPLLGKLSSDHIQQLATEMEKLRARGLRLPAEPCAHVLYLARRFPEAIKVWDEEGESKSPEYMRAKGSVEPYPQRLIALSKMGMNDEVVRAYDAEREVSLTPEQTAAVAEALCTGGRFEDTFRMAWGSSLLAPMLRLSLSAFRASQLPLASEALHASIYLLTRSAQWEVLASFATSLEFAPSPEWKDDAVKDWVESLAESLHVSLVRALGRSKELAEAPGHVQRPFSDFLRRFVRHKETWRPHLSVTEVGAAIERAGRFTDAASFYDGIMKGEASAQESRFAQERWLVSKRRLLDQERGQMGAAKREAIQREVRQAERSLQVTNATQFSRYPTLPELVSPSVPPAEVVPVAAATAETHADQSSAPSPGTAGLPDPLLIAMGPFKIEIYRKNSRCNVTLSETGETAYIKIKDKSCGGEVQFAAIDRLRWTCNAWKLTVTFPDNPSERLLLNFQDLGSQLRLQP